MPRNPVRGLIVLGRLRALGLSGTAAESVQDDLAAAVRVDRRLGGRVVHGP